MLIIRTVFFILLLTIISITAQQHTADSLVSILGSLKNEKKVDALIEISDIYQYINTSKSIEFGKQALKLADSLNYLNGMATSNSTLGFSFTNLDNNKAIYHTKKALNIWMKLQDKVGISSAWNVLGIIYYYMGDYIKSIEYHLKSLKIREELGNEKKLATSYNNIALVYLAIENYETALNYLRKALAVRIKTNNKKGIGIINDNIGLIYVKLGRYDEALVCFETALKINKEIGNKKSEALTYFNLAQLYLALKKTDDALNYFLKALKIYRDAREIHSLAQIENGIAAVYRDKEDMQNALIHAKLGMSYAKEVNSLEHISKAAEILHEVYNKSGDYKTAYEMQSLYRTLSDSLMNQAKHKSFLKKEFDYKIEKIERESEAEAKRQEAFITYLSVTLGLSLIIVILIIWGFLRNRKLNKTLNELNRNLQKTNSSKDRFFSIIAHDLRGPFNALLGTSDILANEIDELSKEDIKSFSLALNGALKKQFELLNDLLDWSKLQSGSFELRFTEFNLYDETNNAARSFEFTAGQKNLKIDIEINQAIIIKADVNMFRLVLRNLLSNSIKFSNKNGHIIISAKTDDQFNYLTISDNGVGMYEEDINKLFRIDVNHSTKGTANEMGTGLGLILCKEIIDKHQGNIVVKSEKGKGSEFVISFPK